MQFENEKFVKVPGQNVVLVRLQIPAGMSLVVSDLIQGTFP